MKKGITLLFLMTALSTLGCSSFPKPTDESIKKNNENSFNYKPLIGCGVGLVVTANPVMCLVAGGITYAVTK